MKLIKKRLVKNLLYNGKQILGYNSVSKFYEFYKIKKLIRKKLNLKLLKEVLIMSSYYYKLVNKDKYKKYKLSSKEKLKLLEKKINSDIEQNKIISIYEKMVIIISINNIDKKNKIKRINKKKIKVQCEICDKLYSNIYKLKRHYKTKKHLKNLLKNNSFKKTII